MLFGLAGCCGLLQGLIGDVIHGVEQVDPVGDGCAEALTPAVVVVDGDLGRAIIGLMAEGVERRCVAAEVALMQLGGELVGGEVAEFECEAFGAVHGVFWFVVD